MMAGCKEGENQNTVKTGVGRRSKLCESEAVCENFNYHTMAPIL